MTGEPVTAAMALTPRAVDPATIERELARLWMPARQAPGDPQPPTRACMSNLIVFCSVPHAAPSVAQEIAAVVHRHPARVLLLVAGADDLLSDVEAHVTAQCHLAPGGRQICSEHVTISVGADGVRRLPSVTRSLLIGDLPTALWWVSGDAPLHGGAVFDELAALAGQVIYDSAGWTDTVRDLVGMARWALAADRQRVVADLAWRRLTAWRSLIGQSLDPAVVPNALQRITEVTVQHGPHGLPQACFLVGWLATSLGWESAGGSMKPGAELMWRFRAPAGVVRTVVRRLEAGEAEVHSAQISWRDGGRSATATFERLAPEKLAVHGDAALPSRTLRTPPQRRESLVAEQLPDLDHDRLFRRVLEVSRTMAEALLPAV